MVDGTSTDKAQVFVIPDSEAKLLIWYHNTGHVFVTLNSQAKLSFWDHNTGHVFYENQMCLHFEWKKKTGTISNLIHLCHENTYIPRVKL